MKLWLYVFKRSMRSAGLPVSWLRICRWYFLKPEESERFKVVLAFLERRNSPMVALGRPNRPSGYLVLKMAEVRDELSVLVPDLVFYAYMSGDRVRSLEDDDSWVVTEIEATPKIMALYEVGRRTKTGSSFVEAKRLFEELWRGYEKAGEVKKE
jgi:hypothetical protein